MTERQAVIAIAGAAKISERKVWRWLRGEHVQPTDSLFYDANVALRAHGRRIRGGPTWCPSVRVIETEPYPPPVYISLQFGSPS